MNSFEVFGLTFVIVFIGIIALKASYHVFLLEKRVHELEEELPTSAPPES